MLLRFTVVLAALACSTAAFAQIVNTATPDSFQVRYAANLNVDTSGNSDVVNITNTGATAGAPVGPGSFTGGNLCLNVYTFDPNEEMVSCCTCFVTPNGLVSLSVKNSLISNTLTPAVPTSVVIKLVATVGTTAAGCNAATITAATLAPGMRAWGTSLHALNTTPVTYGVSETAFSNADLSVGELTHLTAFCSFIQANSGFGICKGCTAGGLGASTSL